ncbi:cysteine hydrolase family protein [Streptomyces gibsoniae]|uniref:Isochorismatase family cysteine hydrolase n=1 Tax=Streptomyces gibsoniae TaxID=3075529 RepID=A0ABU2U7Q6_9ACTN|nr:isochorismatase family cysteine hydrolase [Streptomyces sp. DSM 41699]MDT0469266.1 isochorismatase family cysteine hydrolase [Streptomyces sp. DSM 41699]
MNTRSYRPEQTALVVVDLLNDFLAEDGKLSGQIGPMLDKLDLRAQLSRLLAGAREAGVTVFHAPHGLSADAFSDVKHVLPRFQFAVDNQVFWEGAYGADFYPPLQPQDGDVIVGRHHMFDSFAGTDLHEQLGSRGIEKVVLAGLTSQTCIEGTGRHALEAGYHVTFLTDAVAEFTEGAHRAALDISYPTFGHEVTTIDEFLAAVEPAKTA